MVAPAMLVAAIAVAAAVALALTGGYSHWTVPAVGPWAVAGATTLVADRAGVYAGLEPRVSTAVLIATPAALAATTWVVGGWIAGRRGLPYRERYLAATGCGVAVALLGALLGHLGISAASIVWILGVPLVAALIGTVGFLATGFVVSTMFTDLRVAGLYTVVTVVLEGVAAVAAARGLDAPGGGVLVEAVRTGVAAAGLSATWWAVAVGQLVVGLCVVFAGGRIARVRADVGRAAVLVVSVVTLWSGTTVLLSAAALG
jgi:hypothetical protein